MKLRHLFLSLSLLATGWGQSSEWTSSDGRTATMTLISVSKTGDKLTGTFKLNNGTVTTLSEDKLAETEKERLQAKLDEEVAETEKALIPVIEDTITPAIEKDLIVFDGRKMKRLSDFTPPTKYYLFYETASWCGPCQKFTPQLVEFYNEFKKSHGDQFELILLTSDNSKDAQEKYSESKKMEWPQMDYKDTKRFKKKFGVSSNGIPSLTLTDLSGKKISTGNAYGMLSKVKAQLK